MVRTLNKWTTRIITRKTNWIIVNGGTEQCHQNQLYKSQKRTENVECVERGMRQSNTSERFCSVKIQK